MKKVLLFILILYNKSLTTFSREFIRTKNVDSAALAVSDAIREIFTINEIYFDIIIYGWNTNVGYVIDKLTGINSSIELLSIKDPSKWNHCLTNSSIIFVHSTEDVKKFMRKINLINDFPRELNFLFYIENFFNASKIEVKMPNYDFGNISHFSYFISHQSKSKIQLSTFEWWTESSCGEKQLKILGEFNKKSQKWKKDLKVPQKYGNFHNCTLIDYSSILQVSQLDVHFRLPQINDSATPFYLTTKALTLKQQFEHELSKIFAYQANYTLEQRFTNDSTSQVHRIICPFFYRDDYHYGTKYREIVYGLLIPKWGKYSSYEKMVMPFDRSTWICLIVSFLTSFVVIFIVRVLPKWVKNAVFGIGVTTPALNVVKIIFGYGQSRLPLNNSARIIFICFVMFCEVFKTAYQGVFFEMMTTDIDKPTPENTLELKNEGYTIYTVGDGAADGLRTFIKEEERPEIQQISISMNLIIFPQLGFLNRRMAVLYLQNDFQILKSVFALAPKLIKQKLLVKMFGIGLFKNNFMIQTTDPLTRTLVQAGIPQYFLKYVYDFYFYDRPEIHGPFVFSVEDLKFGFIIWLVTCGIALVAFFAEIIFYLIKEGILEVARLLYLKLILMRLQITLL